MTTDLRGRPEQAALTSIGFTVKSGWAGGVLLSGPPVSSWVVDSRGIDLSDPATPGSPQPYHAGFGTARDDGRELARLVASAEQFGEESVSRLIRRYRTDGHHLRGAGIVAGSLADPERFGNAHIRIHALEGRRFRGVVQEAVAQSALTSAIWRERDVYQLAARFLKQPEMRVRASVAALGRTVAGSWRAEQKTASLAAWPVLASAVQETAAAPGPDAGTP